MKSSAAPTDEVSRRSKASIGLMKTAALPPDEAKTPAK